METVISEVAQTIGIELKLEQEKAIRGLIQGNDVFVSLPTGFGKSLIYELLPGTFDRIRNRGHSVALVVSPLIASITDQIASFSTIGISAIHFSESLHKEAKVDLQQGKFQIIFISPETLFSSLELMNLLCTDLYHKNVIAFVVDGAHCIKKW